MIIWLWLRFYDYDYDYVCDYGDISFMCHVQCLSSEFLIGCFFSWYEFGKIREDTGKRKNVEIGVGGSICFMKIRIVESFPDGGNRWLASANRFMNSTYLVEIFQSMLTRHVEWAFIDLSLWKCSIVQVEQTETNEKVAM